MIPFNKPSFNEKGAQYLAQALASGHASGNGPFTKQAEELLTELHSGSGSLLTSSCTNALELAARLLDLQPGDEVIVPSYTFVSTASAFIWNGAKPVFADIRADTLNIDPESTLACITSRTKAICIVHYGGVGADPDVFAHIAQDYGLTLIEDNAHGLGATHKNQTLGTFGSLSALSFHETKNVTCGEGGALILNDPELMERAEILREKGTNRSKFLRGLVDKYTWVDAGSSWVMSDLLAALLVAQLEQFAVIQARRQAIWARYQDSLHEWAEAVGIRLPEIPVNAKHSAHMYFLRLQSLEERDRFISYMQGRGVNVVFHYQTLHDSPYARGYVGSDFECPNARATSETLVRLPLYLSMTKNEQDKVIAAVLDFPR